MNTSRLSNTVQLLLESEQIQRIQKRLGEFQGHLNNLVSNPQNPPFQTECMSSLENLSTAANKLRDKFEPYQIKAVEEIAGKLFFVDDFPADFRAWISENSATPAVAKDKVDKFIEARGAYIDTLNQLKNKLEAIGVEPLDLAGDEAEIGFLIPRILFDNHLEQMIKELHKVNRILRAFSELETGSPQPVEVRTISTSDPLYSFGLPMAVILAVGKVVKWALDVWKEVEQIRQIRAQTLKINSFTDEEVEGFYGNKIKSHVEAAIENKLKELLDGTGKKKGREHELRQELHFALEYILAGIERGLMIEIRHLPPPPEPASDGTSESVASPLQSVAAVAKQLSFPAVDPTSPVLALPNEPETPASKSKRP